MTTRTKYILYGAVAAFALAGLTIFYATNVLADDPTPQAPEQEVANHDENTEAEVVLQTPDTVPNPDNAILAAETGLPIEQIDAAIAAQDSFGEYARHIQNRYPGQISGIWMDSPSGVKGPSTRGNIRFTGAVPPGVKTTDNVRLTGGAKISLGDNNRRSELIALALQQQGYRNVMTYYDQDDDIIRIRIKISESAKQPNKIDLLPVLNQHIGSSSLQGRAAQLDEADFHLTVYRGDGPIVIKNKSRGGNRIRNNNNTSACTSGWSVDGPNGPGIITAGHCDELNKFEQPGVTPYNMTLRNKVLNALGDVAYYTTSHVELAEFYSASLYIRYVDSIKPTNEMVGNSVCFYGRASNTRTCTKVTELNVALERPDGTIVENMAVTESTPSISGDSGGGWSYGYTAWGVDHGYAHNTGEGFFTPVETAQDALNVTIKTQ